MSSSIILDRKQWAGRSIDERHLFMSELHVPHRTFVRVFREIARMSGRSGKERRGYALFVLAESGIGKSHLARTFSNLRPRDDSGENSLIPIVTFEVPAQPTQKSLGSALLKALKAPMHNKGSAQDILDRCIHHLDSAKTRIIFLDNVQDIPERRRANGVMQVGNWIRQLIDRCVCLLVLLGTHAATEIADGNSQLRRRVPRRLTMERMDPRKDAESAAQFFRFLAEVDKLLPLAETSELHVYERAVKIFYATFGVLDYIFQLFHEALVFAVLAGRERILDEDLSKAFQALFLDSGTSINPFAANGPQRVLSEEGEPFHNWYDPSNPTPAASSETRGPSRARS